MVAWCGPSGSFGLLSSGWLVVVVGGRDVVVVVLAVVGECHASSCPAFLVSSLLDALDDHFQAPPGGVGDVLEVLEVREVEAVGP